MLKNFLITTLSRLLRDKLFSGINIAGLSVSLAACILIGLYVHDELSYDKHWRNGERIYMLNTTLDSTGSNPRRVGVNSILAAPALKKYFAEEIEAAARLMRLDAEVRVDEFRSNASIFQVDGDVLEIFDFEEVAGDLRATLESPDRVALSEPEALRLFGGTTQALGKTISLLGTAPQEFNVTAVYRLPRKNSVVQLPALTLLDEDRYPYLKNWTILNSMDYLLLKADVNVNNIIERLPAFVDQRVDIGSLRAGPQVKPSERIQFGLVNVADVYLEAPDTVPNGGNFTLVLAFSAISLFVMLIGCTNFIILSMAKAMQRVPEVTLRKVLGARRGELVWQYLGESALLVAAALVLGLVIVEVLLPVFAAWIGKSLLLDLTSPLVWLSLASLVTLVIGAGGLYPAFALSYFRPASTLKTNRLALMGGSTRLRDVLVLFQFAITIVLMVSTATVYLQMRYTATRDPGYNRHNLLVLDGLMSRPEFSGMRRGQLLALQQRVEALPGVMGTSLSGHQPMQRNSLATIMVPYKLPGQDSIGSMQLPTLSVDSNFFSVYETPLVAGRGFSDELDQVSSFFDYLNMERGSSQQGRVLINAAAARYLGFSSAEEALGRQLDGVSPYNDSRQTFTIIGVVADTQFFSLRSEPRPELYLNTPYFANALTVRYQGNTENLLRGIDELWRELSDAELPNMKFVDEVLASEFDREQLEARLLVSFSLLAVSIACLGLLGAAAFNITRRTKEIGIRRVLGAEVREVATLLLWQFSKPVMLANLVAWPIALSAMLRWLQRFPYQIDPLVLLPLCFISGALAIVVAWLAVAGTTLRVASAKPVLALRYE